MEPFTLNGTLIATRRKAFAYVTVFMSAGLSACQPDEPVGSTKEFPVKKEGKEAVIFDIGLFVYLDRPIFDVYLNGSDIGVGGPYSGLNGSARGLMTGVAVPLGPQVISWRLGGPEGMPGNGDTVKAVNQPVLLSPNNKFTYLGVHIYPDNTVELIPSEFWPETSERGVALWQEWRKKNGQ